MQSIRKIYETIIQENTPEESIFETVKVTSTKACVVHGHPKKKGSKTDKPKGSVIKCYPFSKYGRKGAIKKAHAMHYAIVKSQEQRKNVIKEEDDWKQEGNVYIHKSNAVKIEKKGDIFSVIGMNLEKRDVDGTPIKFPVGSAKTREEAFQIADDFLDSYFVGRQATKLSYYRPAANPSNAIPTDPIR